jgi:hypothetical protein
LSGQSAPRDAAQAFRRDLALVVGCVTREPLVFSQSPYAVGNTHSISFAQEAVASLRRADGSGRLKLGFRLQYRIIEEAEVESKNRWRARTVAYEYRILDATDQELLAFHWQPGPAFFGPDFPHLHIAARLSAKFLASETQIIEMSRFHVPTGMIAIGFVVRLLVTEFQVVPTVERWEEILHDAEATHWTF